MYSQEEEERGFRLSCPPQVLPLKWLSLSGSLSLFIFSVNKLRFSSSVISSSPLSPPPIFFYPIRLSSHQLPSLSFPLQKLDSYDDENFLILTATGTNYLCKVHNGVESDSPSIIDYQNRIMLHLNAASGVATTSPLPTVHNAASPAALSVTVPLPVQSSSHSPHPLAVRLLTYIPGTPMAYKSVTPSLLVSCGSYLAAVDASLDGFSHPSSDRFHIWCQENTLSLRPFLSHVPTASRRALVKAVVDAFEKRVLPDSGSLRRGVLQSDFNDANIIIGDNDEIAGCIDFGDSVRR